MLASTPLIGPCFPKHHARMHACLFNSQPVVLMPITIHLRAGQLLLCNFSQGFKEPEMIKDNRPVVGLTPPIKGRDGLVTVVATKHSGTKDGNAVPLPHPSTIHASVREFPGE